MRGLKPSWLAICAGFLVAAAVGHGAFVFAAPYVSTDLVLDRIEKTGAQVNVLRVSRPRTAESSVVQMDNADTLTAGAILDLSEGPVAFRGVVPMTAEYWSISIFAHNTDTAFLLSDRDAPPGSSVQLLLAGPGSRPSPTGDERVVEIPTNTAFFLIRATMRDRSDEAGVAALRAELQSSQLGAR